MLTPMKKRLIAGLTLLAVISAGFGASLVFPGKRPLLRTKRVKPDCRQRKLKHLPISMIPRD